MRRKLLDISEKIDPLTVGIYELIASVAEAINLKFVVVGATARDLIMLHGFGVEISRATRDIDMAVQVKDWNEFEQLKKGVIETGHFVATKMMQRVLYQNGIPVDIVPFGPIKDLDSSISWPPTHEVRMNILGFEEAYSDAMLVRIKTNPKLDIFVVSPTSLAVLKLLAWKDRGSSNKKDAIDLDFIIRNYLDVGNRERLFGDHSDLVDNNFEYVRVGARLLGRDIVSAMSKETIVVLKQILEEQTVEGDRYPLVEDMSRSDSSTSFEESLNNLRYLNQGILDNAGQ